MHMVLQKIESRLDSTGSEVKMRMYKGKLVRELDTYISKCARLAWKMVTQTPPICIQTMGGNQIAFNAKLHVKCRVSPSAETEAGPLYVKSILWPAMYEEGSERVISKGEVEFSDPDQGL